jgi:hypothetical protein
MIQVSHHTHHGNLNLEQIKHAQLQRLSSVMFFQSLFNLNIEPISRDHCVLETQESNHPKQNESQMTFDLTRSDPLTKVRLLKERSTHGHAYSVLGKRSRYGSEDAACANSDEQTFAGGASKSEAILDSSVAIDISSPFSQSQNEPQFEETKQKRRERGKKAEVNGCPRCHQLSASGKNMHCDVGVKALFRSIRRCCN